MADGHLNFDTKIDDTDFEQGIKSMSSSTKDLKNVLKNLSQYMEKIFKIDTSDSTEQINKTSDATEDMSSKMMSLNEQLKKAELQLGMSKQKLAEFASQQIPTEEYSEAEKSAAKLEQKLLDLLDRKEKFEDTGGSKKSRTYQQMEYDIDTVEKKLESAEAEMTKLNEEGKKFTLGSNSSEYQKMSENVDLAQGKVDVLKRRIAELEEKEENTGKSTNKATSILNKMSGATQRLSDKMFSATKSAGAMGGAVAKNINPVPKLVSGGSNKVDKLGKKLTGMVKKVFVFSMMTKALRTLRSALQNVISGDKDMERSLAQIKGNLLTAFAPLYSFVLPGIKAALAAIITFSNYLANITSKIFGKSIAQSTAMAKKLNKQAKATDKVTSATKKANSQLADYDELRVMDNDDSDSSAPIFGATEVNIPWVDQIKKMISSGDWEGIGKLVASKLNDSLKKIPWSDIQKTAGDIASRIARTLNGFFSVMDLAYNLGNTVAQALNTGLNFAYTFLTTFDFQQFGTFIGNSINSFVNNFDWGLLGSTLGAAVQGAIDTAYGFVTTYDWGSFASGIATSINDFFASIDWSKAGQTVGMAVIGILKEISTFLAEVDWNKIGQDIGTFLSNIDWNEIISEVFEVIGNAIQASFGVITGFMDGFTEDGITPAKTALLALAGVIAGIKIGNFVSGLISATTAFAKNTAAVWSNVRAWIANKAQIVLQTAATLAQKAATVLETAAQTALNVVLNMNPIAKVIIVITALIAVFVLLWKKCDWFRNFWIGLWKKITELASSAGKAIKDTFTKACKAIKSVWNGIPDFFSKLWQGIKNAFSHVTDWFKDTFSKAWQAVKDVFSTGGKIFSGIKDGIADTFKLVVNSLISGINVIIKKPFEAINGMLNKIRGVGIGKAKPFKGLWAENPLTIPEIPKLATGAVIPPRAPFTAVLGDQKNGTNIEAPLDTIKQAVREELAGLKGSGTEKMEVNVYLEGDAKGVFKLVKAEASKFNQRTGKPAFS